MPLTVRLQYPRRLRGRAREGRQSFVVTQDVSHCLAEVAVLFGGAALERLVEALPQRICLGGRERRGFLAESA
ncbi:MAG: hypothetical protein CSB44_12795 [Gammaproteobacteria bacterium]|nr:MAG: hypothetical protein CSB44_12795 [Gammaproteobacteria bacterium]